MTPEERESAINEIIEIFLDLGLIRKDDQSSD